MVFNETEIFSRIILLFIIVQGTIKGQLLAKKKLSITVYGQINSV